MNLDNLINATVESNSGAKVISDNQDMNGIAIETGAIEQAARDRAGRREGIGFAEWDAYEYGISAEEARRRLDNAATDEDRKAVMDDLRQRAIDRANLATINGRITVAVAGDAAWHQLGVRVDQAMTSAEALQLAGLGGWDLRKVEQTINWNGETLGTGCYGIVLVNDGQPRVLSQGKSLGSRYTIVSNEDCFALLDTLGDQVRYETAGAVGNGSTVWMLTDIPGSHFAVEPGDEIEGKLMLSTTHDGSGAIKVYPTTRRPECENTYTPTLSDYYRAKAGGHCLTLRHTKSVKKRINQAKSIMRETEKSIRDFGVKARHLAQREMDALPYFHGVLDGVMDATVADTQITQATIESGAALDAILTITESEERIKAEKSYNRVVKRRAELLDDILDRYETDRCAGSTGWSAWNAVTESVDHGRMLRYKGDDRKRAESRLMSTVDGRGAEIKDMALEMAIAQTV